MKDIKEIIHLYKDCEVLALCDQTGKNEKGYLTGFHGEYGPEVQFIINGNAEESPSYPGIENIKLILRRLSSMDEHNKEELFDHIWPVGLWGIAWAGKMAVVEHILGVSEVFSDLGERVQQFMSIQDHAEMVDWLRSKGFWVGENSAFDQGIIIDKATI